MCVVMFSTKMTYLRHGIHLTLNVNTLLTMLVIAEDAPLCVLDVLYVKAGLHCLYGIM